MTTRKTLTALALLLLLPMAASAWDCNYWIQQTDPNSECYRPPTEPVPAGMHQLTEQQMAQGQQQGQGQGQEQDAAATAAAVAAQRQAMVSNLQATGTGGHASTGPSTSGAVSRSGSDVMIGGDSSSYNARAYAIGLPSLVGAPPVMANCLRHSRGMGAASAGVTGGTFYDEPCRKEVERAQLRAECFAMADRLALWGRPDAAVNQLTACGGVVVPPMAAIPPAVIPPPVAPPADYVPRQEFEQHQRDEREIRERMLKREVSK
jgi:hypothetical protein